MYGQKALRPFTRQVSRRLLDGNFFKTLQLPNRVLK